MKETWEANEARVPEDEHLGRGICRKHESQLDLDRLGRSPNIVALRSGDGGLGWEAIDDIGRVLVWDEAEGRWQRRWRADGVDDKWVVSRAFWCGSALLGITHRQDSEIYIWDSLAKLWCVVAPANLAAMLEMAPYGRDPHGCAGGVITHAEKWAPQTLMDVWCDRAVMRGFDSGRSAQEELRADAEASEAEMRACLCQFLQHCRAEREAYGKPELPAEFISMMKEFVDDHMPMVLENARMMALVGRKSEVATAAAGFHRNGGREAPQEAQEAQRDLEAVREVEEKACQTVIKYFREYLENNAPPEATIRRCLEKALERPHGELVCGVRQHWSGGTKFEVEFAIVPGEVRVAVEGVVDVRAAAKATPQDDRKEIYRKLSGAKRRLEDAEKIAERRRDANGVREIQEAKEKVEGLGEKYAPGSDR